MKKTTIFLLAALAFLQASAQKLPTVQTASVKLPDNFKIDGKADEWDDKFKAFNPATDLSYTIANDDKRLYIIFLRDSKINENKVQTGNTRIRPGTLINSIVYGGIRINIQKNATKTDKGAVSIKFPYFENGNKVAFNLKNLGKIDEAADSTMKANNKKLTEATKWIYTDGIAGVDSVLPIYNDKGIEVANAFDIKKNYICEVAIDLQLLGLSAANATKFTYHILVNADPNKYTVGQQILNDPNVRIMNIDGTLMSLAKSQEIIRDASNVPVMNATTDFWGGYTLAK